MSGDALDGLRRAENDSVLRVLVAFNSLSVCSWSDSLQVLRVLVAGESHTRVRGEPDDTPRYSRRDGVHCSDGYRRPLRGEILAVAVSRKASKHDPSEIPLSTFSDPMVTTNIVDQSVMLTDPKNADDILSACDPVKGVEYDTSAEIRQ